MSYCSYEDVKGNISTDLEEVDVDPLIVLSDSEINARADMTNRTATVKRLLSIYLTCERIAGKDPKTASLGPASFTSTLTPAEWRLKAENLVLATVSTTVTSNLPILVHQAGGD